MYVCIEMYLLFTFRSSGYRRRQNLAAKEKKKRSLTAFNLRDFNTAICYESWKGSGAILFDPAEFPMTNDIGSSFVVTIGFQDFPFSKARVGLQRALVFLGTFVSNFANTANVVIFVVLLWKHGILFFMLELIINHWSSTAHNKVLRPRNWIICDRCSPTPALSLTVSCSWREGGGVILRCFYWLQNMKCQFQGLFFPEQDKLLWAIHHRAFAFLDRTSHLNAFAIPYLMTYGRVVVFQGDVSWKAPFSSIGLSPRFASLTLWIATFLPLKYIYIYHCNWLIPYWFTWWFYIWLGGVALFRCCVVQL